MSPINVVYVESGPISLLSGVVRSTKYRLKFMADVCCDDSLDIRKQREVGESSQETEGSGSSDVRCLDRKHCFPLCAPPPALMVKADRFISVQLLLTRRRVK